MKLRDELKHLELEVVRLKRQLTDSGGNERAKKKKKNGDPSDLAMATAPRALHLGKEFATCVLLWPSPFMLQALNLPGLTHNEEELAHALEDGPADAASVNPSQAAADAKAAAALLRQFLGESNVKKLVEPAFCKEFFEGIGAIRTKWISDLQKNPGPIFGITDQRWYDKAERKNIPEVVALLQQKNFLFEPGSDDRVVGHMRHPCILKALQLLLTGLSSATGTKASQARATNGKLWGMKTVTDALLAAVATAVYAALLGTMFAEYKITDQSNGTLGTFYATRMSWLEKQRRLKPAQYEALQEYFNVALFPEFYPQEHVVEKAAPEDEEFLTALAEGTS